MPAAPGQILAARELTPVLRRELRANGPADEKPFRVQTLATREGTTDRVQGLDQHELARVVADEKLESWLEHGELEKLCEHDRPNEPGGPQIHDFGASRRR